MRKGSRATIMKCHIGTPGKYIDPAMSTGVHTATIAKEDAADPTVTTSIINFNLICIAIISLEIL